MLRDVRRARWLGAIIVVIAAAPVRAWRWRASGTHLSAHAAVRLARRGWWAPGVGGALERVGIHVDAYEAACAVGEEIAQRRGVFEHARAGQRGVMLTGCDLVLCESFF